MNFNEFSLNQFVADQPNKARRIAVLVLILVAAALIGYYFGVQAKTAVG